MSDFIDHLFDPSSSGKKGRERIRYREKLRGLINDAPAVRRLSPQDLPSSTVARFASGKYLPNVELLVEQVGETASADIFRALKQKDSVRPIWRLDPISTEEQVLETRAMGADAYTLDVKKHDQASLQFLVEVGRDYGLPAILSCQTPEDLALGILIQDGGILWLRDEIHSDALFDLETLRGRTVIYETAEELALSPTWVCAVIQLLDAVALPRDLERDTDFQRTSTSHTEED